MLKRYQVLLEDWLADYIKHAAKIYDLSFSETIRLTLCFEYLDMAISAYKYRPEITKAEIIKALNKVMNKKHAEEDRHKIISKLYFEGRKAIEFRLKLEKKRRRLASR